MTIMIFLRFCFSLGPNNIESKFQWIIKEDYKNKYLVTGDWSQSTFWIAKDVKLFFFFSR